jgi:hypothetical protein
MEKDVLSTIWRIRAKSKATMRVQSKGQVAVQELLTLQNDVSDESYAKALSFLVHFATPGECISYMSDANVKDKPIKSIIRDMKIFNGVNGAKKHVNFLWKRFKEEDYVPQSALQLKVLVN